MRIALFTIHNLLACSHALFGYHDTLQRMGHKVFEFSFPGNAVQDAGAIAARMPKISDLNQMDAVLVTYAEYTNAWLAAIYGLDSWKGLHVPVIARYDESMDRADLNLPARVPELKRWAQYHFFPGAQDAEKFDGRWLPFGAETKIFTPDPCSKVFDLAFIGSMYPQRADYLQRLAPHLKNKFQVGNAFVQRLSGISEMESTVILAEEYRAIKVFFCLPPLSRLLVQKIYDVMSCGTFVMYPALTWDAAKNMEIFQHEKHLAYYQLGYFADNAKQIQRFVAADDERESIARAGRDLVRSEYSLEKMLNTMLSAV